MEIPLWSRCAWRRCVPAYWPVFHICDRCASYLRRVYNRSPYRFECPWSIQGSCARQGMGCDGVYRYYRFVAHIEFLFGSGWLDYGIYFSVAQGFFRCTFGWRLAWSVWHICAVESPPCNVDSGIFDMQLSDTCPWGEERYREDVEYTHADVVCHPYNICH